MGTAQCAFWTTFGKRYIWRVIVIIFTLCVVLHIVARNRYRGGRTGVRLSAPSCSRSFLLSDAVFPWEQMTSGSTLSCNGGDRHQEPIQSRLRRAKTALGHTPRLTIVGDSRAREIFRSTIRASGHPEAVWRWLLQGTTKPSFVAAQISPATEPHDFCLIGMCSNNASYDAIDFQFVWRPFVNRHLLETLKTLVTECETPRRQCPDMVVVNSGLWYSRRVEYMAPLGQHERVLMFRRGLQQLGSPLAELARRTRTVWKLEEAVLFEAVQDKYEKDLVKTEYMQLLMALQPLVYEMTRQAPELVVWSSLLPQVTQHMFHVCAQTQPRAWPECPDTIHMGRSLQDGFATQLLDDLCDRALNGAPL